MALPTPPPLIGCPTAANGVHNWVYTRVLGTPTRAAAHLHSCTACKEQQEKAAEAAPSIWPPCCPRCGSPQFRPECEVCFEIDIASEVIEPDDLEDAPGHKEAA